MSDGQKSKLPETKLPIGEFNSNKEMIVGLAGAVIVIALVLLFIFIAVYVGICFYQVLPPSIHFLIHVFGIVFVVMLVVGFFID